MDKESEEINQLLEPHVQYYSSSEDEDNTEEPEVMFQATRATDVPNVFDFTRLSNGRN
jgi:hypothetical protein